MRETKAATMRTARDFFFSLQYRIPQVFTILNLLPGLADLYHTLLNLIFDEGPVSQFSLLCSCDNITHLIKSI